MIAVGRSLKLEASIVLSLNMRVDNKLRLLNDEIVVVSFGRVKSVPAPRKGRFAPKAAAYVRVIGHGNDAWLPVKLYGYQVCAGEDLPRLKDVWIKAPVVVGDEVFFVANSSREVVVWGIKKSFDAAVLQIAERQPSVSVASETATETGTTSTSSAPENPDLSEEEITDKEARELLASITRNAGTHHARPTRPARRATGMPHWYS